MLNIFKKNKELTAYIWAIILIVAIVTILIITINNSDKSEYNNGICLKCGGHYELFDVAGYNNNIAYYYKCQSCKNVIMTYSLMEGN